MNDGLILAATRWRTNADLIYDCARLGYLREDALTLDPTWGKGNFWTKWRPIDLIKHDRALDGTDFRRLPYDSESFEQIAFDPPYVSVGGRQTTTIPKMHGAYGLTNAPKTPEDLQTLINDGLEEMYRLLAKKCLILVKCQDYVSSGKLFTGTFFTQQYAHYLGFTTVDRLEHIGNARPQPARSRQVHARRNLSTLFVFKKGK